MGRRIRAIVSVLYSFVYLGLLKLLHLKSFHYGLIQRISPGVPIFLEGRCQFGDRLRVHSGSRIMVRENASLVIGSDTQINCGVFIVCLDQIEIGANAYIAPRVLIYDHDHDYRVGVENNKIRTSPIIIGKNCWIGANSIILRGTKIGDNSVVGAGSIVKGEYPANSLIVQKRETTVRTIERVTQNK